MAEFIVTTLEDEIEDNGTLSLREAIALANASNGSVDTITFAEGLEGTIRLTRGDLFSTSVLTIDGDGRVAITGDALGNDVSDADGITDVAASQAEDGLLLSDNVRIITSSEDITLKGLTLTGGASEYGGAAFSSGAITIIDSVISGNYSSGNGGGAYGAESIYVDNSLISGNSAGDDGGGLYSDGSVTVKNSTVSANTAVESGGAIQTNNGVNVIDSIVEDNESIEAIVTTTGTITATGSLFQDNTSRDLGLFNSRQGVISATNTTFIGNEGNIGLSFFSEGDTLTLEHVTATGNTSFIGGFITVQDFESDPAAVTIINSIIVDNEGPIEGGGDITFGQFTLNEAEDGFDFTSSAIGDEITFFGSNIVGADANAFDASGIANVDNGDPALIFEDEVADNGGPTPTLALLANAENPAIDTDSVSSQDTDARGEDRAVDILGIANGGDVDVGAFEVQRDEAPNPLEVTTLEDVVDRTDGLVSLREAILAANATPGEDTITFADDLSGTIRLTQGRLDSKDALTIEGDGRIAISGDRLGNDITDADGITDVAASQSAAEGDLIYDNSQIIRQEGYTLTLDGLTLTGGRIVGGGGAVGAFEENGYVKVTLIDTTLAGNYARFDGGGVYVEGALEVRGGAVTNNVAGEDGGGLAAIDNVTVDDAVISGNQTAKRGGGVFSDQGEITVTDSEIIGNSASEGGGLNTPRGDITLTNVILAENVAVVGAGDGGGASTNAAFTAIDSVIRDNTATIRAGVYAAEGFVIERTEVTGNISDGLTAGISAEGGDSTVVDSVFSDNQGGVGALSSSGTISVSGSLFQDNTGYVTGAIYDAGSGLTVVNSTFVGNSGGREGGAISSRGPLVLDQVTVTGNTSTSDAGAVNLTLPSATATITNSIITSNIGGGEAGPDVTDYGSYVPYSATITFTGVNIVGEDDSNFGVNGVQGDVRYAAAEDIFVNVVEDNGGPTPTLALLGVAENPALDAAEFTSQDEDARGAPRRDIEGVDNGGTVDLGAFELNATNLNGEGVEIDGQFGAELLLGTDDDDTITGGGSFEDSVAGSGQDTILGFGGDDLLDGEGGADSIEGGVGDDTIIGGPSIREDRADTIFGGDGDDDINGGFFRDQIFGDAGDDTIRVIGDDDIDDVDGGEDTDTLDLSATSEGNAHTVDLERGDFLQLRSEGEAFVIRAGSITNVENVIGGAGTDLVNGDDQANRLEGRDGDDTLLGQGGDDLLEGGDGADLLQGGDGDDTLIGGEASDDDRVDTLSGGDGDDVFDGGFFEDQIFGGAGDDTVLINENDFADNIDGGDDIDTVDFSGVDDDITIVANLETGGIIREQAGRAPNDSGSLVNVENLIGGARRDNLTGDEQVNRLEGRGDDDVLDGGGDVDDIFGGAGDDTIIVNGDDDFDRVDGGADIDTLDFSGVEAASVAVDLAAGTQSKTLTGEFPVTITLLGVSVANVENLVGSVGDDSLTGDNQANLLEGGFGDDILIGAGAADTLIGGAGENRLVGGVGEDEARFDGVFADYEITLASAEPGDTEIALQLTRIPAGGDATPMEETVITGIEALVFADQTVAFADLLVPKATADAFTTDEDTPLIVNAANGVLANDANLNSADLIVELVTDAEFGTLVLNEDGSFTYTPDADAFGEDSFTYLVRDETSAIDEAEVTITVDAINDAPIITSNADFTLAENETAVGAITAQDVDGGGITFTITGGADAGLFDIDAVTGALNFKAAPDFETPGDAGADNIHNLEITATDTGELTDVQALTVEVTDANEAPTITSNAAFSADENQTIAGAVTASDDKAGAEFSITGGADAALFTINTATGVLRFRTAPDFEAPTDADSDNSYEV